MTLHAWTQLVASDLVAARASGLPHLWRTEFKTTDLEPLLHELASRHGMPPVWLPGDKPSPRPGIREPGRVCLVTCERRNVRYVTKAEYIFARKEWVFDDPPDGPAKIVAWMDAPTPFLADVFPEKIPLHEPKAPAEQEIPAATETAFEANPEPEAPAPDITADKVQNQDAAAGA